MREINKPTASGECLFNWNSIFKYIVVRNKNTRTNEHARYYRKTSDAQYLTANSFGAHEIISSGLFSVYFIVFQNITIHHRMWTLCYVILIPQADMHLLLEEDDVVTLLAIVLNNCYGIHFKHINVIIVIISNDHYFVWKFNF